MGKFLLCCMVGIIAGVLLLSAIKGLTGT